ncbi:hypothetical protein QEH52_08265 [Coraliomargarita sp. SDUM461003]|uniref:Uncharacterized protein n=1 Tax=Thalassobacterium maritimum TaxID=3041265 RepID=A0ABU1ATK7_9BACT|nr:hypothetical protein [Coraliomargarita sp. SDUM461003]MDQ8207499.1 hypothetical protein [Coraliomargarita sp. SDUM461003]
MQSDEDLQTTLSKWPFIIGDVMLVVIALAIAILGDWQLTNMQVASCVISVALGCCLFVLPYILEYQVRVREEVEDRTADLRIMRRHLIAAEEQLDTFGAQIKSLKQGLEERAQAKPEQSVSNETLEALATLKEMKAQWAPLESQQSEQAQQLEAQAQQFDTFTQQLDALAQQVNALVESQQSQVDAIQTLKSDFELIPALRSELDAVRAQVAARPIVAAEPTTGEEATTAAEPTTVGVSSPVVAEPTADPEAVEPTAEEASGSTTAEPTLFTEELTPVTEVPVEAEALAPVEEPEPLAEPAAIVEPPTAPAEAAAASAEEPVFKKVRSTRTRRNSGSGMLKRAMFGLKQESESQAVSRIILSKGSRSELRPSAETVSEEAAPAAAASENQLPAAESESEPESEEVLAPEPAEPAEAAEAHSAEAAVRPKPELEFMVDGVPRQASKAVESTVVASVFIGIGNKPFIRGNGPGLSWDRGVEMEFEEIGKWCWMAPLEIEQPIEIQVFRNDEDPDTTGTYTLEPGQELRVSPEF